VSTEGALKLSCNITKETNFLSAGIRAALDAPLEKRSPTLGRDAVYSQKSRAARLPAYLTVHMVRFAWRRDIGKKAKIMVRARAPAMCRRR
jgi:ubiquitin carboxyl-terminal hydrolase 14